MKGGATLNTVCGLVEVEAQHDLAGGQTEVVHVSDDGVNVLDTVAESTRLGDAFYVHPVVQSSV